MKQVAVLLCLVTALSFAVQLPVNSVPLSRDMAPARVSEPEVQPPFPISSTHERGTLDAGLVNLTPAERANARLVVAPMGNDPELRTETRTIEQLWNTGEYDAALARLRELGNRVDPATVMVGKNWRTPVPTPSGLDWAANIQVGTRDSVWRYVFDYHNGTGNLVVGAERLRGTSTGFDFYLSTNNGANWAETFDGSWAGANAISDLSGRSSGDHMYFGYLHISVPESLLVMRFTTAGAADTFANGAYLIAATGAVAGETLTKGAVTSFDDEFPGSRIYAFAGSRLHNVYGAWSDGDAVTWHPWNMAYLGGSYTGGLAATVNPSYTNRYLWVTYDYAPTDSTHYPLVAWVWAGDSIGGTYINLPSRTIYGTSVAVRHDSLTMAYEHANRYGGHYPRSISTPNNGANWYWAYIPNDTSLYREQVNINGRRSADLAAVYRERSTGSPRHIMFTTSDMTGFPWATPDTVSDSMPWVIYGSQVQPLAPGIYGAMYVSYPYANLWFNRSDLGTGIRDNAGQGRPSTGLRVLPFRGGARLAFDNPSAGYLRLRVYDAGGRLVESLNRFYSAGSQAWDYAIPANGVYFATLDGTRHIGTAKLSAVK